MVLIAVDIFERVVYVVLIAVDIFERVVNAILIAAFITLAMNSSNFYFVP